jgi:NAD(P)-dependent dehydrogenase (short-subunit alcohol dehydrogenase family)
MSRVAVITGAAGGLGRALGAQLLAQGWRVWALDLPSDALAGMATPDLVPIPLDLTHDASVAAAAAAITAATPAVDLVIHAAGVTQIRPFARSSADSHRRVMAINHFAPVALTLHLLEAVRRARGVHLAISSVAGFAPLHHRTAYAASKHALQGFMLSLASEEAPHGVACLVAAPSFVATNPGRPEIQPDGLSRPGAAPDGFDVVAPEAAARMILRGVTRRQAFIPVGRVAWASYLIHRASPGLYRWLMRRRIRG